MSTNPGGELPPQLEALIGQLRAALVTGADAGTKAVAAHACRVLLGVLETQPGQPVPVPPAAAATVAPPSQAPAPAPAPDEAPIDRFLAAFVQKFGGDVVDRSVPYVGLGAGASLFAQFAGLGAGVRR